WGQLDAQGTVEPIFETTHLVSVSSAIMAGVPMQAHVRIVIVRIGQNRPSIVRAIHHSTGSMRVSSPHNMRSCLRARNRRVKTAAFESLSCAAISAVE